MSTGSCWAVQVRARMPLLLLARRKYVVALTDRRVLLFDRRRGGPEASDLVIGKRYETFTLERVKRRRPLLQVVLAAASGNRLVFEFRRRQRELAGELIARLTPPPALAPNLAPDLAPAETSNDMSAFPTMTGEQPGKGAPDTVFWGSEP